MSSNDLCILFFPYPYVQCGKQYLICCGFFGFLWVFLHRDRGFEQNIFSNPLQRVFFLHLIRELLEQLSVIDQASPQCWHLFIACFYETSLGIKICCLLMGNSLKSCPSFTQFQQANKQIGEDKALIVCSFELKQNFRPRSSCGSEGTQLLCGCGGITVLWRVLCETGECWLQTACAHNQFLLCHFSFASFVHPAVLHTQLMARYHQPSRCPDDILCQKTRSH